MPSHAQQHFCNIIAKLRLGYRQRQLFIVIQAGRYQNQTAQLLTLLQQWGAVAHFEPLQMVSSVPALYSQRSNTFKVFLRYFQARPAVGLWASTARGQRSHRLSRAALLQLARDRGGLFLILLTTQGLQTVEECVRRRLTGHVAIGLLAG